MKHRTPKFERIPYALRSALLLGAVTTVAACGADKPASTPTVENSSSTANSHKYPKRASDFAWGNHVNLSIQSCGDWTPTHPEPMVERHLKGAHKYLLTVIDARFNSPKDCNPDTDIGAGVYSKTQQDPHFAITRIPDGDVVKVVGWTDQGEEPIGDLHSSRTYPIWEQIEAHDGSTAMVPWVNAGFTALSALRKLPKVAS